MHGHAEGVAYSSCVLGAKLNFEDLRGPPSRLRCYGETDFACQIRSLGTWPRRRRGLDEARPKGERSLAGWTGLEPAASGVTGRRSNQLNYHPTRWERSTGPAKAGRYMVRLRPDTT